MGRQINFYINTIDTEAFIKFIQENSFEIIDENLNFYSVDAIPDQFYRLFLYKQNYGNFCFFKEENGNKKVDFFDSPVIEYAKTIKNMGEKTILRGRLWISTEYYNKKLTDEAKQYVRDFEKLVKWIKKNIPYQEVPLGDFSVKEYISNEYAELVKQGYKLM